MIKSKTIIQTCTRKNGYGMLPSMEGKVLEITHSQLHEIDPHKSKQMTIEGQVDK